MMFGVDRLITSPWEMQPGPRNDFAIYMFKRMETQVPNLIKMTQMRPCFAQQYYCLASLSNNQRNKQEIYGDVKIEKKKTWGAISNVGACILLKLNVL